MPTNKTEVGNDASLFIGGNSEEVPITSASFSHEADISEVQFNTSLTQSIAVTGVNYSGSFEHNGANTDVLDQLFEEQTGPRSLIPARVDTLTIEDSEKVYTFKNVLVGSRSKDLPADDRTSVTYDFTAEELTESDL